MSSRLETFFVRAAPSAPADANEQIAEQVLLAGGLVLMATSAGSLIVALPREAKDRLSASPLVGLVGGVTLDENAPGAKALRQEFARNAARQLEVLGRLPIPAVAPPDPTPRRPT
jgi:hypothetical protein